MKGQLSLLFSRESWSRWSRGWGRDNGVTTSSLFGMAPSISSSASVFLFEEKKNTKNIESSGSIILHNLPPPVLAALADPKLWKTLVQTGQKHTCLANLVVWLEKWNIWKIISQNVFFLQKHPHLLTGNVTTLNTGSLLRTSCLCLVAHRQLRGREICMSFTQMSKSKFTKYALNYLFPRMDYVNDGCRSDFLNVFDVSSSVTPESRQQLDQSSQRWIQEIIIELEPIGIWTVDAFCWEVVKLLEVGVHHYLLLVCVLERFAPWGRKQMIQTCSCYFLVSGYKAQTSNAARKRGSTLIKYRT